MNNWKKSFNILSRMELGVGVEPTSPRCPFIPSLTSGWCSNIVSKNTSQITKRPTLLCHIWLFRISSRTLIITSLCMLSQFKCSFSEFHTDVSHSKVCHSYTYYSAACHSAPCYNVSFWCLPFFAYHFDGYHSAACHSDVILMVINLSCVILVSINLLTPL